MMFKKIHNEINELQGHIAALNARLGALEEEVHLKYETLDEYDTRTRYKFRALEEYFSIMFDYNYNPNKFNVIDLKDDDVEEVTTNNQ